MKNELRGWTLIEGMYQTMETKNPAVSAVITALEAIRPDVESPFIVLEAPAGEDTYPNYCQAFADEGGYICEIRLFDGYDFTHHRAFLSDPEGGLGEDDDAQLPNLTQTVRVFAGFIAGPDALPDVDAVQWLDVSDEFEPVTA
jgi:hypothetical protein